MRNVCVLPLIVVLSTTASTAVAADCPGNPGAVGTSRTIVIDPAEHARIGTMQYKDTLPLEAGEVVLTFDDGPIPQYTSKVLDILAGECVKATFFLVGRMASAYPSMVRRIYNAGHTVGTHSQNHPFTFHKMTPDKIEREVSAGIASTSVALGDPRALAPYFRIPGLLRSGRVEEYLGANALMTWSADFPADDWRGIGAKEITKRALSRLEAKGKGVLLLHDIKPATVLALPALLKEIKARGYRIVHVVPPGERPTHVDEPIQLVLRSSLNFDAGDATLGSPVGGTWPRALPASSRTTARP